MSGEDQSISASDPDEGPIQLPSGEPTASQVAQAHEVQQRLLARPDKTEHTIIELRQLGYSTPRSPSKPVGMCAKYRGS